MSVRQWFIGEALNSFSSLNRVLLQLTEDEVLRCLELESSTLRRRTIIDRLISRAVRMRELSYTRQLKEKFHGTPSLEDHDPR